MSAGMAPGEARCVTDRIRRIAIAAEIEVARLVDEDFGCRQIYL